jgi:DnaJ-class molecular chaperone
LGQLKPGYFSHLVENIYDESQIIYNDDNEKNQFSKILRKFENFYGKPVTEHNFVNIKNENSFPILVNIAITFSEYIKGTTKNVYYQKMEICLECNGHMCA